MAKNNSSAATIDKTVIDGMSNQYKIEEGEVEKVIWLTRVLEALSRSEIANDFALMGGSAIVFLYRDLYRFSTDLDLDFIGDKNLGIEGKSQISDRMQHDQKHLQLLADYLGMELQLSRDTANIAKATTNRFVQYVMNYPSHYRKSKGAAVELDISYRYCHAVLEPVRKPWPFEVSNLVQAFHVQTLQPEELYAGKIIAMLGGEETERIDFKNKIGLMYKRKIRHLYDTYLMAQDVEDGKKPLDLKLLKKLVLLFGVSRIKNYAFFRGDSIVAYTDDDIQKELKSVTPQGKNVPTSQVMKWTVRRFLDQHILNYGKTEIKFIEDFTAKIFRPERIFKPAEVERIKNMFFYKEMLEKVVPLNG
jgi:hypothetical protein